MTKDDIVSATLGLIREKGWEAVSARAVSAKLGSSTMPIYSTIGSMRELESLARGEVARMLEQAQRKRRTDNPSLDLAIGYVAFAREEPKLFEFSLSPDSDRTSDGKANLSRAKQMDDETVRGLLDTIGDATKVNDFLLHSWIFTHGLAELLAKGALEMDDTEIASHLSAAGMAFLK